MVKRRKPSTRKKTYKRHPYRKRQSNYGKLAKIGLSAAISYYKKKKEENKEKRRIELEKKAAQKAELSKSKKYTIPAYSIFKKKPVEQTQETKQKGKEGIGGSLKYLKTKLKGEY